MNELNRVRNSANAQYLIHVYSGIGSLPLDNNLAFSLIYEYQIGSKEISKKEKTKTMKNVLL